MKLKINYINHHRKIAEQMTDDYRLNSTHVAIYHALFLMWNNSGFESEFNAARSEIMNISKVGSNNTYHKVVKELSLWGYLEYLPSKNPMKSSVFNLYKSDTSTDTSSDTSTDTSSATIPKPLNLLNKETIKQIEFSVFWDLYAKKVDSKACKKKWDKLSNDVREKIILHVPKYVASTPDKQFRKNPETYLNNECWNDEVQEVKTATSGYVKQHENEKF